MKKRRMVCVALVAALVFGICPSGRANAAETKQTEKTPADTKQTELKTDETNKNEAKAKEPLTAKELAEYYGGSVFIGDSIMLGFRNYSAKKDTFVHDIKFLAAGSYSAFNAMKPVAGKNVHPLYEGKKYQVWEALPLIGRQRAFILLGMNDISILGLEGARDKYKELVDKILETSPDMEINIISVTYTLKGKGKGKLNNDNIAKYNVLLKEMADENGWGYIDLCTPVSDGKGNLGKENCSDDFVHLSWAAYGIWEEELEKYANGSTAQEAETEKEKEKEKEKVQPEGRLEK